jgi:YidC/Oxa1 family membrane protein insertase
VSVRRGGLHKLSAVVELHDLHHAVVPGLQHLHDTFPKAWNSYLTVAEPLASQYSKVDKTGVIGNIANVIEGGIDLAHDGLAKAGIPGAYGISICLFTGLIKVITLPLTMQQLESTTKMQKLTPLQKKIADAYPRPEDEQTKVHTSCTYAGSIKHEHQFLTPQPLVIHVPPSSPSHTHTHSHTLTHTHTHTLTHTHTRARNRLQNMLMSQLFLAANVNPLAGCLPAIVQIPIFLSLYRALQNLIAGDKLSDGFLWIPSLEGPIYKSLPGETFDWVKSITTGEPILGWGNTLAFLSLPLILFVSQSLSGKILQPPKDPNKKLTEQEEFSAGLVANLPFVVSFFSLGVPAGLAVYWVVNNLLTTLVTVGVKSWIKNEPLSMEVVKIMAAVERRGGADMAVTIQQQSAAQQELRGDMGDSGGCGMGGGEEKQQLNLGFGASGVVDVDFTETSVDAAAEMEGGAAAAAAGADEKNLSKPEGPIGKAFNMMNSMNPAGQEEVAAAAATPAAAMNATEAAAPAPKRKKRVKPSKKKDLRNR